jgi:hypothetical protein
VNALPDYDDEVEIIEEQGEDPLMAKIDNPSHRHFG